MAHSSLGMYDLRVLRPMPYVTMAGHVNSYTRDIGLDVWRDDFVAAGSSRSSHRSHR
jgi:hypothetical protein